jgi:hypothetical protein
LYQPSPVNARQLWNDGQTAPTTASQNQQPFSNSDCLPGQQGACPLYPTVGKTQHCSTDLKRLRWAWMLNQPIVPPRLYAGLDMAKDDLWHGVSIEDSETQPTGDPSTWEAMAGMSGMPTGGLCQSVPIGFIGGCPSGFGACNENFFGNNGEVLFIWNLATHKVDQIELQLGYTGAIGLPDAMGKTSVHSLDNKHTYIVRIGDVTKKDDQPFLIDWNGVPDRQVTEIYDAMIATFGPQAGLPPIPNNPNVMSCGADAAHPDAECTADPAHRSYPYCISGKCVPNCHGDGSCLVQNAAGNTYMGFRPLVMYIVGNSGIPQPALSTPTLIYNFASRFEPYGNLPQVLKLDPEGPVAEGKPLGARDATVHCQQKIGIKFGDERQNCIEVHGPVGSPDMVDKVNLNKMLYGLEHDQEHWTVNAIGVNQNFTSSRVLNDPNTVVLDSDVPQDGDFAQDWFFDLRARGHPSNDYGPGGLEFRGSGLVYIEWARLMLNDIHAIMVREGRIPASTPVRKLGDPACTGFDSSGNPNFGVGCSGIEGILVPGGPVGGAGDFTADPGVGGRYACPGPECLDAGANYDPGFFFGASILKPGDISAGFCVDPGKYTDCFSGPPGLSFSPFSAAVYWVTRLLGHGSLQSLPAELQDRRYYFKWYAVAFMKYLKAYSDFTPAANRDHYPGDPMGGGVGPSNVATQYIDLESLFFDNNNLPEQGGNSFDKFEYIDRENIGKGQEGTDAQRFNFIPWDFEYGCDLIGGNQRYDNYYRRMDREEIALYSAMLEDKTHTPGQENNVNITNLFGSPLLTGAYGSYACATGSSGSAATSSASSCSIPPPLDRTNMTACQPTAACDGTAPCQGSCTAGSLCMRALTMVDGMETVCGTACNFTAHPQTGCALPSQTCVASNIDGGVTKACVDMKMDLNGTNVPAALQHPMLYYYPSVFGGRSPFAMGHSPISFKVKDATGTPKEDKRPDLGVAKITIPNFASGPYTMSPQPATGGNCPMGWMLDATGTFCNAPLNSGMGVAAPAFTPLVPWVDVKPGIGFTFPLDGQHDQAVTTGQLDFTGVLETYLIDYIPWVDLHKASCISDDPTSATACNKGYTCNTISRACEASDGTVQILAIESEDYLGQVFVCQDPKTSDILAVRQYDSAINIINWFANHPGGQDPNNPGNGIWPSAQTSCDVIVRYSPFNNYIDFITSKVYGVKLGVNQGSGLGRVIDSLLYDPGITNAP